MFAEQENSSTSEGNGEGTPTPEELAEQLEALKKENENYKGLIAKTNAENKKYKDQIKAHQSDDEKKAEEEQARQEEYKNLVKENRRLKLSSQLATGGFKQDQVENLVKAKLEDDDEAFGKFLNEFRKSVYDEALANAKLEISKGSYVPNGAQGKGQPVSDASKYAKQYSSKKETISHWGTFTKKQ
jgi:hypothetical protein